MNVIEYAEKKYAEACRNEKYEDARYWRAYLDGAKAQKKAEPAAIVFNYRVVKEGLDEKQDD